jgi:hypothetical protein
VQDANITDGNMFSDEVNVDLDMLRTLVLNRVGGGVDDAYVVTVDESALGQRSMELWGSCWSQQASATPLATARYTASAP